MLEEESHHVVLEVSLALLYALCELPRWDSPSIVATLKEPIPIEACSRLLGAYNHISSCESLGKAISLKEEQSLILFLRLFYGIGR